jgi:hypothetical protein
MEKKALGTDKKQFVFKSRFFVRVASIFTHFSGTFFCLTSTAALFRVVSYATIRFICIDSALSTSEPGIFFISFSIKIL